MAKQLSNASEFATERTNIPDVFSPILEIQPKNGLGLIIAGMVANGEERGLPIYADLRDANGDPLPTRSTSIGIQFKENGADDRTTVSDKLEHIRAYNSLSINEQQNVEHIDRVKHILKGTQEALAAGETPRLGISDVDTAYVSIESDTQIDWANSALYIDRNAVEQVS